MNNLYIVIKVYQHEQEQAQLKERARRLERRLGTLDSEYAQQVENLRAAYQKTLSAGLERDVEGEENIRQRYQAEIEQLRVRIFIIVLSVCSMCD
jgi:chromosome segregation ATPase